MKQHEQTLLIVGAGPCGTALAHAAMRLDFHIVVADCNEARVAELAVRLPGVDCLLLRHPDLEDLPSVDEATFVAIISRDHDTDLKALRRVVGCETAYTGMMGNRAKIDSVFGVLRSQGVSEEQLSRVHAPIGLKLGAQTPEEIAISILAEIIQVKYAAITGKG